LGPNGENTILHISPKFATVHEHVSFQWTLKMHGIPERMKKKFSEERNVEENKINEEERGEEKEDEGEDEEEDDEDEEDEEESPSSAEKGYVAISLYYLDGPVNNICLKAQVKDVIIRQILHVRHSLVINSHTTQCQIFLPEWRHSVRYDQTCESLLYS